MFTGIITNLGRIFKKTDSKLFIKADKELINKLFDGASIAVNGICLTVVNKSNDVFSVDFMPETEARTNIKNLQGGELVNLELPATPGSFLSGYIVQGHIDGVAKLINITRDKSSHTLKFSVPTSISKYIVEKGSIALNGISLTVIEAKKDYFTVGIIPYTWGNTMLHTLKLGNFVNIEVDILAKYLEKLMNKFFPSEIKE